MSDELHTTERTAVVLRLLSTGQLLDLKPESIPLSSDGDTYTLAPACGSAWEADSLEHAISVVSKRVAPYNSSPKCPSLGSIPSDDIGFVELTVFITARPIAGVKLPLRTDDDRVFNTIDTQFNGAAARGIIVSAIKNSRSAYNAEIGKSIWQAGRQYRLLGVRDLDDRFVGSAPADSFVLLTETAQIPDSTTL